jgi:hypothetical protein
MADDQAAASSARPPVSCRRAKQRASGKGGPLRTVKLQATRGSSAAAAAAAVVSAGGARAPRAVPSESRASERKTLKGSRGRYARSTHAATGAQAASLGEGNKGTVVQAGRIEKPRKHVATNSSQGWQTSSSRSTGKREREAGAPPPSLSRPNVCGNAWSSLLSSPLLSINTTSHPPQPRRASNYTCWFLPGPSM